MTGSFSTSLLEEITLASEEALSSAGRVAGFSFELSVPEEDTGLPQLNARKDNKRIRGVFLIIIISFGLYES